MNAIHRPRIPKIIKRPDLVNKSKKGFLALIALIGWVLWFYIMAPLAALFAWWFGFQRFQVFVLDDPARTAQTVIIYAVIIAIGGLLFILWATYNWVRFRRLDRRGAPPVADHLAISQAFLIQPSDIQTAQTGKVMAFDFDENGQITQIAADQAALAHLASTDPTLDSKPDSTL